MSEQNLSEEIVIEITDQEWIGRQRRIAETWAHKAAALEAELKAMTDVLRKLEEAAQRFVNARFPFGIAGHDEHGHPLSYEGVARRDLRRAIDAAQEEE